MLEEPPLFRPVYWVDRLGLHIVMPGGKLHVVPPRQLRIKPDEVISDVLIAVESFINARDIVYTALSDLRVCYTKRPLHELRCENMVQHLHLASYREKLIAKTHWQKFRSRARSSGNSAARPRYSNQ